MQATIKALFAQHSERNQQASGSVLASFGLDLSVAPVPPTPRTTGQEGRTVVSSLEDAPPLAASAREEGSALSPGLSTSAGIRAENGVASLSRLKKGAKDFDYYLVRAPLSLRHFHIALPFHPPRSPKPTFSSFGNSPTFHPPPVKRAPAQVMDFEATCCSRGHQLVSSAHPLWRSQQKLPSLAQEAKFIALAFLAGPSRAPRDRLLCAQRAHAAYRGRVPGICAANRAPKTDGLLHRADRHYAAAVRPVIKHDYYLAKLYPWG